MDDTKGESKQSSRVGEWHLAVAGLPGGGLVGHAPLPAVDKVAAGVAAVEEDGAARRGPVSASSSGDGGSRRDAHGENLRHVAAVPGQVTVREQLAPPPSGRRRSRWLPPCAVQSLLPAENGFFFLFSVEQNGYLDWDVKRIWKPLIWGAFISGDELCSVLCSLTNRGQLVGTQYPYPNPYPPILCRIWVEYFFIKMDS